MGGQEGKRRGLSEVYSVWGFSSHLLGEFVSLLTVLYNVYMFFQIFSDQLTFAFYHVLKSWNSFGRSSRYEDS